MLDGVTEGALKALLAQGGGWVIALLLIVAVISLAKKIEKIEATGDVALKEQFDKRIGEFRVILDALNRSSDALATMRDSVEARTDAINQLVAGFANLVRDLEHHRNRWSGKSELWGQQLNDLQRRMEDLQRRVG